MTEAYIALTIRVRVDTDDKWDARHRAETVAKALDTLLWGADISVLTSLVDETEAGAVQFLGKMVLPSRCETCGETPDQCAKNRGMSDCGR